mmetsp:Transcript_138976/g.387590  ORF Transcript_138976/g.387590 Transcript_138976/m.387590 type:complete len:218 (-) Transcript_138976:2189-2842(-)
MELREDLFPQGEDLLQRGVPRVDLRPPPVKADLGPLLVDHEHLREQQHERREDQARVHDAVAAAHHHRVAVDHPLLAVLAQHLVVPVDAAAKGPHLLVVVQVPVRRAVAPVEAHVVWCEARRHRAAQQRVSLGASAHGRAVLLAHVVAAVVGFHHEVRELLRHHVCHVHGLWAQTLLVAEVIAAPSLHCLAPLHICLQAREVVRIEAFVEVLLACLL